VYSKSFFLYHENHFIYEKSSLKQLQRFVCEVHAGSGRLLRQRIHHVSSFPLLHTHHYTERGSG